MNSISIECVWTPSRREFNRFIRNIEKDNTKVIDHVSIKNKLIKSDPYGQEPSNSIIGLTIINEVTRHLHPEATGVSRVIYLFKNLDFEIIDNFKDLINSKANGDYLISLTLINSNENIEDRIIKLFDSINIIKND